MLALQQPIHVAVVIDSKHGQVLKIHYNIIDRDGRNLQVPNTFAVSGLLMAIVGFLLAVIALQADIENDINTCLHRCASPEAPSKK